MDVQEILKQTTEFIANYTWNVLGSLLIFFVGKWLARKSSSLLGKLLSKQNVDETLIRFLDNIAYYALMVVVLMAAADQLGIDTTSFLAIFGAAGLAVGLALKDSLGNIASGVMLVFFRPFKLGDYVTAGGVSGTVETINVFNTIFLTPDNQRIIVPNGQITNGSITNVSAHPTRRLDLVFGISYEDNILTAKAIFKNVLDSEPRILEEPAPRISVLELANSSVNFCVRPWVKSEDYWDLKFDLTEKIKLALDEAGISIPYPQTDVHLHQVEK
ncbi:MAG: mechanosensitive ion channel [FCB group bacterium]|nr:mechanosensitive ion channel [FCB group bacterium]MBL7028578.1 mechanosensitive ion channel [Candidatus Neomarinimicrobiota bacterium]MBL7120797.1 mechanosensitive ion channel [Candidatus Neomarinimicrobiota bacterium]